MNEFVFTTMRRVFVRFLEEIEDTKKTFRNYLTFSKNNLRNKCDSNFKIIHLFLFKIIYKIVYSNQLKCHKIFCIHLTWIQLKILMIRKKNFLQSQVKFKCYSRKKKLCLIVQYVMEYTTARAAATRYLFTLSELCLFL